MGFFSWIFVKKNSTFQLFAGDIKTRHTISMPTIGDGIAFTGVGDLFAAVFLAHSTSKSNLSEALEYTVATLQAVLKNTLKSISMSCGTNSNVC